MTEKSRKGPSKLKTTIENIHPSISIDKNGIRRVIHFLLNKEKVQSAEISIIFVDDIYIGRLNKKFLNRGGATDVLAFPLSEQGNQKMEGEIYISLDRASRQAKEFKVDLKKEVLRLAIHGILHLMGYDHRSPREEANMAAKEDSYLRQLL